MINVDHTGQHLCLSWRGLRPCLSSAVLNGGYYQAERVVNVLVSGETETLSQTPWETLSRYIASQGWQGPSIGLMTAASMDTVRYRQATIGGESLEVWLSTGLDNARRAGDKADWDEPASLPVGTINIMLITSLTLSEVLMAELLMLVTEAKCAALQELNILSPVSGKLATGTGTDAVVIVGGMGSSVAWAGKHTRLGELAATITIDALKSSLQKQCINK